MKNNIEHDDNMRKHMQSKKYYEYLAKLILEKFLPHRFYDLEISDRPDIRQTAQIGIEVTRTFFSNQAHAEGIFEHIKGKALSEISSQIILKLALLGYKIFECNGIILGYYPKEAVWVNTDSLKEAFINKLKKLTTYQTKETHLFIHAPMFDLYDKEDIIEFTKWAADLQKNSQFRYSDVFIYQVSQLFICHLKEKQVIMLPLDSCLVRKCCKQAKDIVQKYGNNN